MRYERYVCLELYSIGRGNQGTSGNPLPPPLMRGGIMKGNNKICKEGVRGFRRFLGSPSTRPCSHPHTYLKSYLK